MPHVPLHGRITPASWRVALPPSRETEDTAPSPDQYEPSAAPHSCFLCPLQGTLRACLQNQPAATASNNPRQSTGAMGPGGGSGWLIPEKALQFCPKGWIWGTSVLWCLDLWPFFRCWSQGWLSTGESREAAILACIPLRPLVWDPSCVNGKTRHFQGLSLLLFIFYLF